MFEVMQKVAKLSCDYVRRGRWSYSKLIWQLLMIAGRAVCAPADLEAVDEELSKAIDDFDRATNTEALRMAERSGMHHRLPS